MKNCDQPASGKSHQSIQKQRSEKRHREADQFIKESTMILIIIAVFAIAMTLFFLFVPNNSNLTSRFF